MDHHTWLFTWVPWISIQVLMPLWQIFYGLNQLCSPLNTVFFMKIIQIMFGGQRVRKQASLVSGDSSWPLCFTLMYVVHSCLTSLQWIGEGDVQSTCQEQHERGKVWSSLGSIWCRWHGGRSMWQKTSLRCLKLTGLLLVAYLPEGNTHIPEISKCPV